MVAALAIVGAAAVVANSPDVLTLVNVGLPVQLVSTPLVGVPNRGVNKVGLVANTNAPVPVSSVTAEARLAELGVARNVATPEPNPLTPVATGKPVQFVSVPDAGTPNVGVTNVALVNKLAIDNCLVVLVVACTIGNTSALACVVATGNAEMAMFDI
jgi:hypothetical protein